MVDAEMRNGPERRTICTEPRGYSDIDDPRSPIVVDPEIDASERLQLKGLERVQRGNPQLGEHVFRTLITPKGNEFVTEVVVDGHNSIVVVRRLQEAYLNGRSHYGIG